jgi:hypothetical protein
MIHAEGLLHLSAFAAAVSIAYVGLDRIHWDDERFFVSLVQAEKDTAALLLLKFGIKKEEVSPQEAFDLFRFFVRLKLFALCHVANAQVEMGWWCRFWHYVHIQRHVPLLPYFRHRWDRTIIGFMAVAALLIFFYLGAVATWQISSFPVPACTWHPIFNIDLCRFVWSTEIENATPFFFWACIAIISWVCLTGAASQRLQQIKYRCKKLETNVMARVELMKDYVNRSLNKIPTE